MARIALAEMVRELRKELEVAVAGSEGASIRFLLGEVTLEAQVEVATEGGGSAGLKFWVAEVGASGKASSTRVHKVTLKLEPRDREGGVLHLARPPS